LLLCGILSSLLYVALNVAGALSWSAYSLSSQSVSELLAIGAPSRAVALSLGLGYDLALVAFGLGVRASAGHRRGLHAVAWLLMAIGVLGLFWPPMHMRGTAFSLTDALHIAFASLVVVLTMAAVAFGAGALGARFRSYSVATLLVLVVFGSLAASDASRVAANLSTPWLGVTERICIGAYLLWVTVLAARLLRADSTNRLSHA
jgi:hypothetical protein